MTDPFASPEIVERTREQRRASLGYKVGALALTVVGLVLAAFVIAASHAVNEMYGELSIPAVLDGGVILVLVGLPAVLLGVAATMVAGVRGRNAPAWITIPVAFALLVSAASWQADAGARQHEADDAVIAAACSQAEISLLVSMSMYGSEFSGAAGQTNGDCSAWIMVAGDDPKTAMTELALHLVTDGWTLGSGDWRSGVWVRDYTVVRVSHIQSSDGTTGVELVAVNAS